MSKKDKVEAMEAARGTVNTRTGKTVGAVKKSDGNALGGGRNPAGTAPGAVKRPEGNAADMAGTGGSGTAGAVISANGE